jgi:hypothetical protein
MAFNIYRLIEELRSGSPSWATVAFNAALVLAGGRIVLYRVVASDKGVLVVDLFHSRWIAWDRIGLFERSGYEAYTILRDGSRIRLRAILPLRSMGDPEGDPIALLNQMLNQAGDSRR